MVVASACALGAEAHWRALEQTDGVEVFVRPVPGSTFDEVRAVGAVCARIEDLVATVSDVARFAEWIPDTEHAELVAKPSPLEQIYYIRTRMPWPVKDRDMVYRLVASGDATAVDDITVTMEGLPSHAPHYDSALRMSSVIGRWHFVQQEDRTRVTLEMHVEPGGSVPRALAARRIVSMPRGMLRNLKHLFAKQCVGV